MTTVLDTDLKQIILAKVGDSPTGPVGLLINQIWNKYAAKAAVAPYLQELYTLRDCIDVKWGEVYQTTTFTDEAQKMLLSDVTKRLMDMRKQVVADIAVVEKKAKGQRTPAIDTLTRTAPIMPSDDPITAALPDPNRRVLRGDPLFPVNRRAGR